jgi:hypothetical protein
MTATDQRTALVRTLTEMVETLDAPHARVAARIRGIVDELESAPPSDLPDRLLRRVRRLRQGTMGSLSDVVFAELHDGRWVPDQARSERWAHLSQRLGDEVAHLPSAKPPDMFLVTDRVRECWLFEPETLARPIWHVDVFPPIWLNPKATTDDVSLRPTSPRPFPEDGMEVTILWGGATEGGERVLGTGRVFTSRSMAEAAPGRA